MSTWSAVLLAACICVALKAFGYLIPSRVLQAPRPARISDLLTVALLSSLIVTQGFLDGDGIPTLDARAGGLAVAVVLLLLRAPFLVVVAAAAVVTALLRLWL